MGELGPFGGRGVARPANPDHLGKLFQAMKTFRLFGRESSIVIPNSILCFRSV